MPCLNEEQTIGICIQKALSFLKRNSLNGEVLVVDNGSSDNSVTLIKSFDVRLIVAEQRGYGYALIAGIKNAKGNWIIMGDSDNTYNFENLEDFVSKLSEGYDIVLGNRFSGKIETGAMPFLHKYVGNPVLSFLGRLFFKVPVRDFHCGLRAGKKLQLQSLNLICGGMEFATEMIAKAALHKLIITEVPITLHADKTDRSSHLRTWRDGWRHLRFMLLYSPAWLFLYPGVFLLFFFGIITTILFIAPLQIGKIIFDVHTMLYAGLGIIVGFQFVLFYIYTKIYVTTHGLMPPVPFFEKSYKYFNLERGLLVGFTIFISGVFIAYLSFRDWQQVDFGHLNTSVTLRKVIPSIVLIILGLQTIFSSFFMSVLGIKRNINVN
jgi:glycosyltransferase involved in cell wall biosynthesis